MLKIDLPEKPTCKDFGLSEKDLIVEEKRSNFSTIIMSPWLWGFILYIAIVAFFYWHGLHASDGGRIVILLQSIGIGLVTILELIPISIILFGFLFILFKFLYSIVIEPFIKVFRREGNLLQNEGDIQDKMHNQLLKCKEKPHSSNRRKKILKRQSINNYNIALKTYEEKMAQLRAKYKGIEQYDYDVNKYAEVLLEGVFPILEQCCDKTIEYIKCKSNKDWWIKLSAEDFEEEVAKWYRQQGYNARCTKYIGDGGVDVIIEKDGKKSYVQCKHYTNSKVDIKVVRELLGVMSADKIAQGAIVCLYGLTSGSAYKFAGENNIRVVTLESLVSQEQVISPRVDMPDYMSIGPFRVIKDVFGTIDEASESVRMKYPSMNQSIMEISSFYYAIVSKNGECIEDYRNKTKTYACPSISNANALSSGEPTLWDVL